MDLTATSHYDSKTATVRAEEGTTRGGRPYIFVSDAQLAAAATQARAVSGDHMTLPEVEGYSEWQAVETGLACYRLEAGASRCACSPGPIRYYETPDDPCRAVCAACDYHCQREEWAGWTRLDPATLADGVDPTHCEHCGGPLFAVAPETGQDCHSVWGQLARRAVACCRSEFPGEGPDWDSEWWYGWQDSWRDGEFEEFLAACKGVWAATRGGQDGIGGYTTADLEDARREHAEHGGYLLQIGDRPAIYAVCDESEAIEAWGRTPEQLAALTDYAEA